MTGKETLRAARRVLEHFESRISCSAEELAADFAGEESLLVEALEFLRDRDELMMGLEGQRIYERARVTERLLEELRHRGPMTAADLAQRLELPPAIACEVIGWLEREGRLKSDPNAERLSLSVG